MPLVYYFQQEKPTFDTKTPESALRAFLFALIEQDVKGVKTATLPLSEDDLKFLLKSEPVPAAVKEAYRSQLTTLPLTRVKAGDPFRTPDGRVYRVPAEMLSPDRALFFTPLSPVPLYVLKAGEEWRVDAGPIVAGRRAAEAARKRQRR